MAIVTFQNVNNTDDIHYFSTNEITQFEHIMHEKQYKAGAQLATNNNLNDHLHYVKDGIIKITTIDHVGRVLTTQYLYSGDFYREFSSNENIQATSITEAVTECNIASMTDSAIEAILSPLSYNQFTAFHWIEQIYSNIKHKLSLILPRKKQYTHVHIQ